MTHFMKAAIAAAALSIAPLAATADNSFALQEMVMDDSSVTLDLINAESDGMVVIYDYTGGEFGDALGMATITAGANDDVMVTLDNNIAQSFAAVLYAGETEDVASLDPATSVAWTELDIDDES